MMDPATGAQVDSLAAFARKGGAVVAVGGAAGPWRTEPPLVKTAARVSYRLGEGRVIEVLQAIADPNAFALEMRQVLGRDERVIDIWNGITVLTVPVPGAGRKQPGHGPQLCPPAVAGAAARPGHVLSGPLRVTRGTSDAPPAPAPRWLHGVRAAGAARRRPRVPEPRPLTCRRATRRVKIGAPSDRIVALSAHNPVRLLAAFRRWCT